MIKFIVRRMLWAIPVLWLVATVTFFLMHATPGSPWDAKNRGGRLDPRLQASFDRQYGLDQPLIVQYGIYLKNAVHLDFGTSYQYEGTPVVSLIEKGFPYSAKIGVFGLLFAVVIGIPVGILAALKQNTVADYVSLFIATIGYTIPSFVIGIFALVIFAVKLNWVSVLFDGSWKSYILPSVVLGLGTAAFIARLARSSILEILRQDYVRTARAKGLRSGTINFRHVIRNGMVPIVTVLGPALAALITGTIIIEQVFAVPGMGYTFIASINARDYPLIMATTIFYAFVVVLGNLLVDITYGFLDPRIKVGS